MNRGREIRRDFLVHVTQVAGSPQKVDGALDAGIVDEDVEFRESRLEPPHHGGSPGGPRYVTGSDLELRDSPFDGQELCPTPAADYDTISSLDKNFGKRQADAGCPAGDQNRVSRRFYGMRLPDIVPL
jgi:hypothetical protein